MDVMTGLNLGQTPIWLLESPPFSTKTTVLLFEYIYYTFSGKVL